MLRAALVRRLSHRIVGSGEVVFPAVPALVDHYLEILEQTAGALGRPFSDGREGLRRLLLEKLEWGFRRSSSSTVRVRYATSPAPKLGMDWTVSPHELTLDDQYREWPRRTTAAAFRNRSGRTPHAARADPRAAGVHSCLDVGAGTGRNTLPLARAGFRPMHSSLRRRWPTSSKRRSGEKASPRG